MDDYFGMDDFGGAIGAPALMSDGFIGVFLWFIVDYDL
jgi:hypothetical protein